MRMYVAALSTLALVGCAPAVKNATESGVIIQSNNDYASQTQILADTECKKYGKKARLNQAVQNNVAESTFFFDCI